MQSDQPSNSANDSEFVTFGGDMMMPFEFLNENETEPHNETHESPNETVRHKRAVARFPNLWPGNQVPYILDARFTDLQKYICSHRNCQEGGGWLKALRRQFVCSPKPPGYVTESNVSRFRLPLVVILFYNV